MRPLLPVAMLPLSVVLIVISISCTLEQRSVQLGHDGWLPEGGYYEKVVHYGTTRPDMMAGASATPGHDALLMRLNSGNSHTLATTAYGRATVMIPYDKRVGGTEGMSLSDLQHDIGWEEFASQLTKDDLVLFIHGYATTFTNAATRAAQLAYDTNFQGQAVLFSWPSDGSFLDYETDKVRADENTEPLARFLVMLSHTTRGEVHVVAHSMGTYLLMNALAWLDGQAVLPQVDLRALRSRRDGRLLGQVVLAAPDIDEDDYFYTFEEYDFRTVAKGITLYSSHNDVVLSGSRIVNRAIEGSSHPTLGDSSASFSVIGGMDTVDARQEIGPQFFGHSFYAEYRGLVADIHLLLSHEAPPARRILQGVTDAEGQQVWFIRPTRTPPGPTPDGGTLLLSIGLILGGFGMLMCLAVIRLLKRWGSKRQGESTP